MNHLLTLITLNGVNSALFWLMWKGFHFAGQSQVFLMMLIFQIIITLCSFGFYASRDESWMVKLVALRGLSKEVNPAQLARLGALIGAYGMGSVNLVVAAGAMVVMGTIDVWAAGNAS